MKTINMGRKYIKIWNDELPPESLSEQHNIASNTSEKKKERCKVLLKLSNLLHYQLCTGLIKNNNRNYH